MKTIRGSTTGEVMRRAIVILWTAVLVSLCAMSIFGIAAWAADMPRLQKNNGAWQLMADGKTLITRKGSNERISGMGVKLSTD